MIELAGGFEAVGEADWMAAVETALKGRPFEKLRSRTYDGLPIEPLYRGRRDAEALAGRAAGLPWTVMARIEHPDPAEANALLLEDLENGASGVDLVMSSSNHARGAGLTIDTVEDLERLLDGVYLDLVTIRIDGGYQSRPGLAMILALAEKRGVDPAALNLRAAIDPISCLVNNGWLTGSIDAMTPRLWDVVHHCEAIGLKAPVMSADGRTWHGRGASEAQELGYTLSSALHYLRMVAGTDQADLEPQTRVEVVLAADADQFATIAKLRAMRKLWARVLDACGLRQVPLVIHAETAWRMMTRRDPWVNMLRTTVAAFAAGVGGADSVTVLPFSEALGVPDAFARRVARNTQTILIEESNLHRVADPSAGSGAVEALTDALTREAWTIFQGVEGEGGIAKAYMDGSVREAVSKTRAARDAAIASRRDVLTGTSGFPNLSEKAVNVLSISAPDLGHASRDLVLPPAGRGDLFRALIAAARDGATAADIARARDQLQRLESAPMKPHRVAEPFEALRDASDGYFALHQRRPKVMLATFGRVADYTARATWAKNFFEAGGIEAVISDALADAESAEFAFRASGADIVCLCSSDALYAEKAVAMSEALKTAGAAHIYLAGRPVDEDGGLEAAGIEMFLYEGCDVLGSLKRIHASLGLTQSDGSPEAAA